MSSRSHEPVQLCALSHQGKKEGGGGEDDP